MIKTMTIEEAVHFLERQKNGVDVIKRMLERLDLEIDPSKVILVAGTNGKGTTCAALQTLLLEAGKSVGFNTSPHFVKINERIKFNGQDVSDEDFCEALQKVREKIQDFNPTYFEYLTLMSAYCFFKMKKTDYAIFEVGLGGTYDASNAIPHNISVIARLGMDHEAILGNSIIEIARNKFGIISDGGKVFHASFDDKEVAELARKTAKERDAEIIESRSFDLDVNTTGKYPVFEIKLPWGNFPMKMQGRRAAQNIALAATVCDNLLGDVAPVLPAISKIEWPGRMEKVEWENRDVFLSGDHNLQGIESLLEILQFYRFKELRFVVGICHDKSHFEMLRKLSNFKNSRIYLTETPLKTLPLKGYDEVFLKRAEFSSSDPIETLNAAVLDSNENDLIVVTGSLYLVGAIKCALAAKSA
ncbi:MAG: hypothetical protein LBL99_01800 [Holosporaceae bacterium]|jgi:dihydrofolate synthase/folylpolyglutamate synthase|nr:hypothetical protein [Holosporaceae bacterium]